MSDDPDKISEKKISKFINKLHAGKYALNFMLTQG
jgi:uncharacterized protein (DUF2141 family)